MNTELSNIAVAETLLKFVIERLNNVPSNISQADHEKLQVLAENLYKVIANQLTYLRNQYWFIPWPFKRSTTQANEIESRIKQMINSLANKELKNSLLGNTPVIHGTTNIPSLITANNKEGNTILLSRVLNYCIDYYFTPAYNQLWFETIETTIEKYKPHQSEQLKSKLKQYSELNEINRVAKSNFKSEQKLNTLLDTIQAIDPSDKNYAVAKNLVNVAIEQILQEQLPKEIQDIVTDPTYDKPTKLTQIYLKLCSDGNVSQSYIKNDELRARALVIAKPFIAALEKNICDDLEQDNQKPLFQQIIDIDQIINKAKGVSGEFSNAMIIRKNYLTDQLEMAINSVVTDANRNVYQKIEAINALLGGDLVGLSSQFNQVFRMAKEALRKNINQEVAKIFNQESLNSSEKLKQLRVISRLMAKGSALHQSFVSIVDGYVKILVANEIKQFAPLQGHSSLQQLAVLNDLTLHAHHLNLLDEATATKIKQYNNPLLWKIACEIDLLNRQFFIAEPALNLPEDITKFKLSANAFGLAQRRIDAITKTFVAYILTANDINEACLKIEQSIVIANHLLHKGAIDSFLAIMTALNNGAVTRLKSTINGISPQARKLFTDLNRIADTNKNFPALRQFQSKAMQSGVDVVPSIIMLSKDLTSAAEKPAQSKEIIVNLVNQFNRYRKDIAGKIAKKAGKMFQENLVLEDNVAYQNSEKLEPKNAQNQRIPTIFSPLQSLVLPYKLKTDELKKKTMSNDVGASAKKKSGSSILLDTANNILRSSSSGSYIATVLAMAADVINNNVEATTTTKTPTPNQTALAIEPIELQPLKRVVNKPQHPTHTEKKTSAATENKAIAVLKTITKAWDGFLGFVSLDMKPKSQPRRHSYIVTVEKQNPTQSPISKHDSTSIPYYSTRLPPRHGNKNNNGGGSYQSNFFSQPRERRCAAIAAAKVDDRNNALSSPSILVGVN